MNVLIKELPRSGCGDGEFGGLKTKVSEIRPWGNFEKFTENVNSTVKIITVEPNHRLSLQYHNFRDEFWKVIRGRCSVVIGGNIFVANEGDEFFIPRKVKHRILTKMVNVKILEISLGHFDESDIVRIEDAYDRV